MKRKLLVGLHVTATGVATLVIATFFISSLLAELSGDLNGIKLVKRCILYALPILILAMPTLAITGSKLAGNTSTKYVKRKKRRMKLVMLQGLLLIGLAVFLYYQSHMKSINDTFLIAQSAELIFGLINLTLIGLNAKDGLALSGRFDKPID